MSTTESTARARYCFQLRIDAPLDGEAHCLASDCMAWRWLPTSTARQRVTCEDRYATVEPTRPEHVQRNGWLFAPWDGSDYPAQWLEPERLYQARRRGYCGLAGKPEKA